MRINCSPIQWGEEMAHLTTEGEEVMMICMFPYYDTRASDRFLRSAQRSGSRLKIISSFLWDKIRSWVGRGLEIFSWVDASIPKYEITPFLCVGCCKTLVRGMGILSLPISCFKLKEDAFNHWVPMTLTLWGLCFETTFLCVSALDGADISISFMMGSRGRSYLATW